MVFKVNHSLGAASVLTINKAILLNSNNTTLSVNLAENVFKLSKFPKTKKKNYILVIATSQTQFVPSLNSNTVQRKRPTYHYSHKFPKLNIGYKTRWLFWKFKYHGKGLKIKKSTKNKAVIFNLGCSHDSRIWINSNKIVFLRTKKNTYTIISNNPASKITAKDVKLIRPFNKYTRRGLRVAKQPVWRRFGKVSQIAPRKR